MAAQTDAPTLVILGTGYTGRVIYRLAAASRRTIRLSSRTPERSLADVPASVQLGFNLTDPTTWATIPDQAEVIVTFPVQPIEQVEAFARDGALARADAQHRERDVHGDRVRLRPEPTAQSPAGGARASDVERQ